MKKYWMVPVKMLIVMVFLLGIIYPLCITGLTQLVFPSQANGSLVEIEGKIRGSRYVGQRTDSAVYFNPRPSATEYNTLPSGASNLSLTSRKLHDMVVLRKNEFIRKNMLPADSDVPSEMLFASASGLDPHISQEAAKMQIGRIVETRGFSDKQKYELDVLIDRLTESPQFGIFGCRRVNVFMLNLELDKLK